MEVMKDPEFTKKYPELYKRMPKKEEKQMDESKQDDKMTAEESETDVIKIFLTGIEKCTNFAKETRAVDDIQELFDKSFAIVKSNTENSTRVKRYAKSHNNAAIQMKPLVRTGKQRDSQDHEDAR